MSPQIYYPLGIEGSLKLLGCCNCSVDSMEKRARFLEKLGLQRFSLSGARQMSIADARCRRYATYP